VLLNKVLIKYTPKYGAKLASEVRYWSEQIRKKTENRLRRYFPDDSDGSTSIAYIWARTVISEAPGQGGIPVEIPLLQSMWLAKKRGRNRALRWVRDAGGFVRTEIAEAIYQNGKTSTVRRPLLEIFAPHKASDVEPGTSAGGAATCPVTGYTMPVENVRRQLSARRGGASDARMVCVVTTSPAPWAENIGCRIREISMRRMRFG
jgi:adenine-specific DNA methylase